MAFGNTGDWDLYTQGIDYKNKINLFANQRRNERFYAGHHWEGSGINNLPQVRLNITKRIVNWKAAQIMSDMLTMQYSAETSANYDPNNPSRIQELQEVADLMSDYAKTMEENLKQEALDEQAVLDSELSGDGAIYYYWDETVNAGLNDLGAQVTGDINAEIIDNVCYFPGNTSEWRPNDKKGPLQPYIILAFRKLVKDVKAEAKASGASQMEIDSIIADADIEHRAGDRARQEPSKDNEGGFCTVLLKMWPQEADVPIPHVDYGKKTIWARKSTQSATVRKDWDTGLHRYPLVVYPWTPRKNSCHGEAEATELIPNNIAINRLMATMILWVMINAYPKPIYDKNRIDSWSNDITAAIPVDGDITGAAMFLQSQGLTASVQALFELLVSTTKDTAGANETALGDNSITKTAAGIIALQKASSLPLSINKRRFAQFKEDQGLIYLDFWLSKYNVPRMLAVEQVNPETGQKETVYKPFNGADYADVAFKLRIDVGASSQYSDITALQTLDNWLAGKFVSFKQYLERIRQYHVVPDVQSLIDELDQEEQQAQNGEKELLYELMARFVDTLPPEQQAQIKAMKDPEQMEAIVKQLIMQQGGMDGGMSGVQQPVIHSQQQVV